MITHIYIWQSDKTWNLIEMACHRTCYHETNDWNQAIFILGQEITWQQWSGETNVKYTYWQICTNPPTNGNFCKEHGNAIKSRIRWDSYTIQHRILKWTKKLYFHLLNLTILNSLLFLTLCGARMTQTIQACLHVEFDWKVQKFTLPTLTPEQTNGFGKTS
jgi:hypothetical protein